MKRHQAAPRRCSAHCSATIPEALEQCIKYENIRKAAAIVEGVFRSPSPAWRDFEAAVDAVVSLNRPLRYWRPRIERAFRRLNPTGRRRARRAMMSFYWSMMDFREAVKFIPKRMEGPLGLSQALWSLVEANRAEGTGSLATRCQSGLKKARDRDDLDLLHTALAKYWDWRGRWEKAEKHYDSIRVDSYLYASALARSVLIEPARGLNWARILMEQLQDDQVRGGFVPMRTIYRPERPGDPAFKLVCRRRTKRRDEDAKSSAANLLRWLRKTIANLEKVLPRDVQRGFGFPVRR